jgi:hypothetical protein
VIGVDRERWWRTQPDGVVVSYHSSHLRIVKGGASSRIGTNIPKTLTQESSVEVYKTGPPVLFAGFPLCEERRTLIPESARRRRNTVKNRFGFTHRPGKPDRAPPGMRRAGAGPSHRFQDDTNRAPASQRGRCSLLSPGTSYLKFAFDRGESRPPVLATERGRAVQGRASRLQKRIRDKVPPRRARPGSRGITTFNVAGRNTISPPSRCGRPSSDKPWSIPVG